MKLWSTLSKVEAFHYLYAVSCVSVSRKCMAILLLCLVYMKAMIRFAFYVLSSILDLRFFLFVLCIG